MRPEFTLGGSLPNFSECWELSLETIEEYIRSCRAEEALLTTEAKSRSREKFFSLVCHDLRSPISVARICADLIQRQPQNGEQALSLSQRILQALTRANRMITDLLDYHRIQAEELLSIKPAHTDLYPLLVSRLGDLALVHDRKCVYLNQSAKADSLAGFWDADLILRAVENLVINACKYGDPRSVVTLKSISGVNQVVISVHNCGNPIPPADIPHLFDWRRRATTNASAKGDPGGWGLGLALVKGVAEAHGGDVNVESDEKGTTFSLLLPLDPKFQKSFPFSGNH